MHFALLGNHHDGVAMAAALIAPGRFDLAAFTSPLDESFLKSAGRAARRCHDLEDVLSDPKVELVIVAGVPANRPAQLRRALQAERHVLVVHPADRTPEVAYEASMIQKDTGCFLLPLLPDGLHPAVARLRDLLDPQQPADATVLGHLVLIEMIRPAPGEAQSADPLGARKPALPGWEVFRALGGEIAEVSAFAAREDVSASETVLVSGRFEHGGLLQLTLTPGTEGCRLVIHGARAHADLDLPQGWRGPAFLSYSDKNGAREEMWPSWDPWAEVCNQVQALLTPRSNAPNSPVTAPTGAWPERQPQRLSWEDEIRCLELDDAARRSVERRRSSVLEYQEASEDVGFKGTMTLVGCGLMWVLLGMLLVLALVAQGLKSSKSGLETVLPEGVQAATCVGIAFGLPLVVFLALQLLRIFARKNP
jgi:predicted dehydrogenase